MNIFSANLGKTRFFKVFLMGYKYFATPARADVGISSDARSSDSLTDNNYAQNAAPCVDNPTSIML